MNIFRKLLRKILNPKKFVMEQNILTATKSILKEDSYRGVWTCLIIQGAAPYGDYTKVKCLMSRLGRSFCKSRELDYINTFIDKNTNSSEEAHTLRTEWLEYIIDTLESGKKY